MFINDNVFHKLLISTNHRYKNLTIVSQHLYKNRSNYNIYTYMHITPYKNIGNIIKKYCIPYKTMVLYTQVKTNLPARVSVWGKEYITVWYGRPSRRGDIDIYSIQCRSHHTAIILLFFVVSGNNHIISDRAKGKRPLYIPVPKKGIKR